MAPLIGTLVRTAALSAAMIAAGCASTLPSERAAPPPIPSTWRDALVGAESPVTDWWRGFNDPALNRFVAEALAEGPSLQLAISRVREARALSRSTRSQFFPEVLAVGSGQYSAVLDGPAGAGNDREQMSGTAGAQVSWELPLFAIGPATSGARANTQSALADMRGAQVALAADVAQAYVDLRVAQASRIALVQSIDTADELAKILAVGVKAGYSSEADAADALRLAETARTRLPDLVVEERRAGNVLSILRGRTPGTEDVATQIEIDAIDRPVPYLWLASAPAAPADLLRLRPDIARAEAQTLIAASQLGVARADLLPRLNITGSVSITEALIGNPIDGDTLLASVTPLISIPLFDWGRRVAVTGQRDAQFEQSLIQYRQAVTQAVADASYALASLDQARLRLVAAQGAEDAAATTARGSRAAYNAGIQSLADRLRADQQLIDANLTRIDAEAQLGRAAIAVYRAFGGGPAVTSELVRN